MPLIKDHVTLETLAEDSLISIEKLSDYFEDGEYSDSIFVYKKQIEIEKNQAVIDQNNEMISSLETREEELRNEVKNILTKLTQSKTPS